MMLLKSILVLLILATAARSRPTQNRIEVRGQNYESIQDDVSPSTSQEGDTSQLKNSQNTGFYIRQKPILRSSVSEKKEGRRAEGSPEIDDYFNPNLKNKKIHSRHRVETRGDSNHQNVPIPRRRASSHLRRRLGHLSTNPNPAGSRNEGEYGYNYQVGNGDVQIHQHIHEYVFGNTETRAYNPCCNKRNKTCCLYYSSG